ncbi:glycosyltransferase family 1 protein [Mucilaginibacter sp.]|uniref:glycosyltransferase family 4 protein n=1 Tax=Mucilaginibacter sp. TaxID=1882438 RepID=UPI002630A3AE|nr:glycosyltransferase family 1 protein [Mucilaginibacter sp.]MDB4926647.1 glycosyl transferase group 1 [Mucilaginibacter sp.]
MNELPKNIAFISEHASPLADLGGVDTGGQNVYVAQLAKFLASENYKIDIYTRLEDPSRQQVVSWLPGIRVIHVKAGPAAVIPKEELLPYMPEFRDNMMAFISGQEMEYHLIHANFFMSGLVASEIKARLEIPFAVTFHALGYIRQLYQGNNDKFPPERIRIEKRVAVLADRVIAECPQDRQDMIDHYQVPAEKITVIPCGFSRDEFYPIEKTEARKKLQLQSDEPIILQLGRMVPRKGVDNVIKALGQLKIKGKKICLVIVGGESEHPDPKQCPEINRLYQIAQEHDVVEHIHFVGRKKRDILKYYYAAADIFVTTPWYEPFGITPLEAMACGTPVIGSNVGGIKYSVLDGETGALVTPDDPVELAEKLDELIFDQSKLKQLRLNAINRVNKYFTWANVARKVSSLYQQIIDTELENKLMKAG